MEKRIKFITLTNDGYVDYTLNCLKSLELIDFQQPLYCYSLGKIAYNILKSKGYACKLLNYDADDTKFTKFRQGNWHNIRKRKFEVIHSQLLENDYVCFTDGDIVFLDKKFMNFCLDFIKDNDMIIQNDMLSDSDHSNLCSGFMFVKANSKTLDTFHPRNVEKYVKPGWDDQVYVNNIKSKLKYETLPLQFFPNGRYYYRSSELSRSKSMIVHFNWVVGHTKKTKMIQYKKWYNKDMS